jgi:Bacterial alpha-L-rhamnosidase C-terminal domain
MNRTGKRLGFFLVFILLRASGCTAPIGISNPRCESAWRRDGGNITLDVSIPPGATAVLNVPAKSADVVTESGQPAAQAIGVKFPRIENGAAVFAVESGRYSFASR